MKPCEVNIHIPELIYVIVVECVIYGVATGLTYRQGKATARV